MDGVSQKEARMQVHEELIQELDTKSYDELVAQHQAFERKLEELTGKTWLTPEEELEVKQIKKLKLLLKDRIARIASARSS